MEEVRSSGGWLKGLKQRLEDRDQAHAWIQAKLQVTLLQKRTVALEAG
jgi:hypothetical protein